MRARPTPSASRPVRGFSMHPSQLPPIKQRVLRADAQRLAQAVPDTLACDEPAKAWQKGTAKASATRVKPD